MGTSTEKENVSKANGGVVDVDKLVICLPPCPQYLKIGDYVFATRWSDADWNDPWCVGFIAELGRNYIVLSNEDGSRIANVGVRGFRRSMQIDAMQGVRIVKKYTQLEGCPFDTEIAYGILFDI